MTSDALLSPITLDELRAHTDYVRNALLRYRSAPMLAAQMLRAQQRNKAGVGYDFPNVEFAALVYWAQPLDAPTALEPDYEAVEGIG